MRIVLLLALCLQVIAAPHLFAQSGDTVITISDSTRASVRETAKQEFRRWQDSMSAVRIKEDIKKRGKSLDAFLEEMRETERAQKRQRLFLIGLGTLFFLVLVVSFVRRRKKP